MELTSDTPPRCVGDELADNGFLVTSTDDLIALARTGSLYWVTFGLAYCAIELNAGHDAALRHGAVRLFPRGSPRRSDLAAHRDYWLTKPRTEECC
jgi:NADH-quinone oxidoreductase subunit B